MTLWVLQAPLFVLLAFYIFMVSKQILLIEQNDISVLKSRGASRMQIIGIYMMQGVLVSAVSLPAGLGLGVFLCRMLGASNGFLYLVQRAALTVEVTLAVGLYAAVAAALSFFTMLIPVIGFSRTAIVEHKQKKRGIGINKPIWLRFYLDILCLGTGMYGWYSFNNQREFIAVMINASASGKANRRIRYFFINMVCAN